MAVSKPGYQAFSGEVTIEDKKDNVKDITLELKAPLDLSKYDSISSDEMKVYIGKNFRLWQDTRCLRMDRRLQIHIPRK